MNFLKLMPAALLAGLVACGGPPANETVPVPVALVKTSPAVTGDLPVTISGFGAIEFDPAQQRTLNAEIEARVLELKAQPGDSVEKGSVVLRLAPSSTAGVTMTQTRRDANAAAEAAARARRLRDDGLASNADVEAAENTAKDLAAQAASLESRAGSIASMRSPIAGVVDAVLVEPGDLVAPGAPMVRLASPGAIQARVGLEIEDAARLKSGDAVTLKALDASDTVVKTTVRNIDARIDPATRMTSVLVEVPAGHGLLSGEAVRADITVETRTGVIIVPREAIFLDETGPYVFVSNAGAASLKRIETGAANASQTEVKSGLKAGEAIIIEGGAILSDGMKVRTADPAMATQP